VPECFRAVQSPPLSGPDGLDLPGRTGTPAQAPLLDATE